MATKTFKVSLSLDNPRIIQTGIKVRSFDKQSIKISIELTKNSQVYQIPTGAQIKISLLKLARQEQKIILDVPFTSADSIDWIVPDYLDGYQGEVRVGVYLIVGTENIDVGYFNITSSVSDIDSAAEEFTESVLQGWAIEDLTALLPKFQAVLDETTGKDVISAPEIILARDGATTLGERLEEDKAEVTAQLAHKAEKGEVGSPLTANSVNDMTDTSRVYVNTTDGNWYSYNGTEWVIGGTYNSEGLGNGTVRPIHLTHEIKSDITENQSVNLSIDDNSFWNSTGSQAVKEAFTGFYRSTEIDVYPGESVAVTIQVGTSSKQRGIVVTDDSYTILWKYDSVGTLTQVDNYELTIPTNGTKLLLTDYYLESIFEVKKVVYVGIASKSYVHNIMDNLSNTEDLSGQTFSVLSDSTSAYAGYIPEPNVAYYTGSNAGVSDVSEMWWSVLAKKTGMTPLVINAWSGSKVSNIDLENNGFKPASVLSRATGLHVGVNKPDNIIIKMGINDFSKSGAVIGTWSGGSSLPPANNDFSTAYAMMLSRIRGAYPDSKIYCVSLGIFVRTNTDKNGVEYNGEGKTVYDYNEVIRKMCDLFGATYIDTQNIGITRQNIYPTYAEDYSSIPTHYNAAGHLLLGESVAKKITQP